MSTCTNSDPSQARTESAEKVSAQVAMLLANRCPPNVLLGNTNFRQFRHNRDLHVCLNLTS